MGRKGAQSYLMAGLWHLVVFKKGPGADKGQGRRRLKSVATWDFLCKTKGAEVRAIV